MTQLEYTATTTEDEGTEYIMVTVTTEGTEVGAMNLTVSNDECYIERIDVWDGHRGQGIGTEMLRWVSAQYGLTYTAPDNTDAQRLYDRIGCEMRDDRYQRFGWAIDQGYGVYEI